MTMITPSYLGETIEYSSLHACRSTLEDPTQMIDTWISGEWMAYRQLAAITPMYTVRFGLNFIFPDFVLGR